MAEQYTAPWDQPQIRLIIELFGGKVTEIKNISVVEMPVDGGNNE